MFIYRSFITKDNDILNGYLIKKNKNGFVFAHIEDFHLDGYMWLRKDHIISMRFNKTDIFQSLLLEKEGINKQVSIPFKIYGNSVSSIFKHLISNQIIGCTVSGKNGLDSIFGQCIYVDKEVCWMREVLADGTYKKTASRIPCSMIVGIHRGGEYLQILSKYILLKSQDDIQQFLDDDKGVFYDYE